MHELNNHLYTSYSCIFPNGRIYVAEPSGTPGCSIYAVRTKVTGFCAGTISDQMNSMNSNKVCTGFGGSTSPSGITEQ